MKNKKQIYKLLLEFSWFTQGDMVIYIDNALMLKEHIVGKCKNSIINFMADFAVAYIIERLILDIYDMWDLLDDTLKDFQEKPLTRNSDYKDLKILRDKLVGHRYGTTSSSLKYKNWYKQNYGSPEKTFKFLRRVALKLSSKIDELDKKGRIAATIRQKKIKKIKLTEIKEMLNKL